MKVPWGDLGDYAMWKCQAVLDMALLLLRGRSEAAISIGVDLRCALNKEEYARAHRHITGEELERAPRFWCSPGFGEALGRVNHCTVQVSTCREGETWGVYDYRDYVRKCGGGGERGPALLGRDDRVFVAMYGCVFMCGSLEGVRALIEPKRC